jgi:hypothetical protein
MSSGDESSLEQRALAAAEQQRAERAEREAQEAAAQRERDKEKARRKAEEEQKLRSEAATELEEILGHRTRARDARRKGAGSGGRPRCGPDCR